VIVGLRDATGADGGNQDDGTGYHWVKPLAFPTDEGTYAFKVNSDSLEFLGPAKFHDDGLPLLVSDLAGATSTPTDDVSVVEGWLGTTLAAPCAFPEQGRASPQPDISSYYCGGSWLADEQWDPPTTGLTVDGGLHVQGDAYESFAQSPASGMGETGNSRRGTYLVRNAGCPEVVTGECPVWRMVGRLDESPVVRGPTPNPSTSAPPVHVSNQTPLTLMVHINADEAAVSQPYSEMDVDPSTYAEPWHVTVTTGSGRQLIDLTYQASDVAYTENSAHGRAQRVDLSCGRLDVYAGPPMLGPAPPASFSPHDCDEASPTPLGTIPAASPTRSLSPSSVPQPLDLTTGTKDHPPCGASYLDGTLIYGSVYRDQVRTSNMRIVPAKKVDETDVVWPKGYTAVYDEYGPVANDKVGGPAVVDPTGKVVARYGDFVRLFGGLTPSAAGATFDACAGLAQLGPDVQPLPTPLPDGYVRYVNLDQATAVAAHAYKAPSTLRSYAAGDWPSVVQELFGPGSVGRVPFPSDVPPTTLVWGLVFSDGHEMEADYLDLMTGQLLQIDHDDPVPFLKHRSDIAFADPIVEVDNNTPLDVSIFVNDAPVTSFTNGTFDARDYGPAPWTISARSPSGREITSHVLNPEDIWSTTGDYRTQDAGWLARHDLSCGRFEMWAGSPPSGPGPLGSFPPGDCDP